MNRAQEQSIKERMRTLSKERDTPFATVWQNLILERFLARLCQSKYKRHFILKGGALLARYIDLGRETKDLDFLIKQLSNTINTLTQAIDHICSIKLDDSFRFQRLKIVPLIHPHMHYQGAQVSLLATLGKTRTHLQIDLGFGDIVDTFDHSLDLLATRKGPLFESKITLPCYPKEFIFAEKLETVIFRGAANSRMKDFHDLFSLVSIHQCLDTAYAEKVIITVFNHRQTSLQTLPINFDEDAKTKLSTLWQNYQRDIPQRRLLPSSFENVISSINNWLKSNTSICK